MNDDKREPVIHITNPLSIHELKRKAHAFRELYGEEPDVRITGHFRSDGDVPVHLEEGSRVTDIGNKYLTVEPVSGGRLRIKPAPMDSRALRFDLGRSRGAMMAAA